MPSLERLLSTQLNVSDDVKIIFLGCTDGVHAQVHVARDLLSTGSLYTEEFAAHGQLW